jgi:D-serine deaminase-like pyridoxal phosphate-dependent protein
MKVMCPDLDVPSVAGLADQPLDWRYKGIPASWWGRTPAEVCAAASDPFDDGAVGPLCMLRDSVLTHNLKTMADWCREHGVELAPHGKTHMAPQLLTRQLEAGACAVTVATVSQVRTYQAFGVRDVVLANEVVDDAGVAWLGRELDAHPDFGLVCWVDSVRGVGLMAAALAAAGVRRQVDVCVEVGMAGGRTGCRGADAVDEVARAAANSERLRLVGVAGYEAVGGHDVTPAGTPGCGHTCGSCAQP